MIFRCSEGYVRKAYRVTGGFNLLVCLDEEHSGAATPTES